MDVPHHRSPRAAGAAGGQVERVARPFRRVVPVMMPRAAVMMVGMPVTVRIAVVMDVPAGCRQLTPGRQRDPAAERDERDARCKVDCGAEALGQSRAAEPHREAEQQGRDGMAEPMRRAPPPRPSRPATSPVGGRGARSAANGRARLCAAPRPQRRRRSAALPGSRSSIVAVPVVGIVVPVRVGMPGAVGVFVLVLVKDDLEPAAEGLGDAAQRSQARRDRRAPSARGHPVGHPQPLRQAELGFARGGAQRKQFAGALGRDRSAVVVQVTLASAGTRRGFCGAEPVRTLALSSKTASSTNTSGRSAPGVASPLLFRWRAGP